MNMKMQIGKIELCILFGETTNDDYNLVDGVDDDNEISGKKMQRNGNSHTNGKKHTQKERKKVWQQASYAAHQTKCEINSQGEKKTFVKR